MASDRRRARAGTAKPTAERTAGKVYRQRFRHPALGEVVVTFKGSEPVRAMWEERGAAQNWITAHWDRQRFQALMDELEES